TMEAGPERLRHQLRRKNQLNANRGSTENRTVPFEASQGHQVWVTPQTLSGELSYRMTTRQIFGKNATSCT
ncbi:hypothetical protein ACFVYC_18075, partial [Pseudarthrobacter sp. NPDC058329]|uniref:hypothetical protein n=1 Tax=Pseudarthrobacter sp. NPDC058329 TaxID=3346448 RepID=UPI0036DE716C